MITVRSDTPHRDTPAVTAQAIERQRYTRVGRAKISNDERNRLRRVLVRRLHLRTILRDSLMVLCWRSVGRHRSHSGFQGRQLRSEVFR